MAKRGSLARLSQTGQVRSSWTDTDGTLGSDLRGAEERLAREGIVLVAGVH